jgi:predicted Na+-dependent transporter
MDMSGIAVSLIFMVVIPTIIGVALNETSKGKIPDAACPWLNPLSKIGLALVVAANASPVAKIIRIDPIATQAIFNGSVEINLDTAKSAIPAAKAGKIKGNPSFRIDIFDLKGILP